MAQTRVPMLQYFPAGSTGVSGLLLITLLSLTTRSDLKTRKIPNRVTYPFGLAALGLNLVQSICKSVGWQEVQDILGGIGLQQSLIGGAVVFSGMFFLFLLGCGAGDVKLMTVVGLLLGFKTSAEIWFSSLCIAAVFILWLMLVNTIRSREKLKGSIEEQTREVPRRIPLAPFFLAGTLFVIGFGSLNNGDRLWQTIF